jgi:peptidoglycan/xylan/chitin deacetylase (PgdA/CDA1 family)
MIEGGMAIGSHTHTHRVLSQLDYEQQSCELKESKSILSQQLKIATFTLAYPVGARTSFSGRTAEIARDLGYSAAFSYYGGNNAGLVSPYDVKRNHIGYQSPERFQVQAAMYGMTGRYWP